MSKTAIEVLPPLTPEIGKRVERIKTYHEGTLRAFQDQMGYAFLSGVELLALKESCDRDFLKICDTELPDISKGSRTNYMNFSKALIAKFPTVGNLAAQPLLITNGRIEAEASKKICKAVHDVADGKTLTEMYRDLGVIRQPKKQVYTPPKEQKLSLAEQHAQAVLEAQESWKAAGIQLLGYGDKFVILTDGEVNGQLSLLEEMIAARRAWVNTPANKRDPKAIAKLFHVEAPKKEKKK